MMGTDEWGLNEGTEHVVGDLVRLSARPRSPLRDITREDLALRTLQVHGLFRPRILIQGYYSVTSCNFNLMLKSSTFITRRHLATASGGTAEVADPWSSSRR